MALITDRVTVGLCLECREIGLLGVRGRCWWCGGWIGNEYPLKAALRISDLLHNRVNS